MATNEPTRTIGMRLPRSGRRRMKPASRRWTIVRALPFAIPGAAIVAVILVPVALVLLMSISSSRVGLLGNWTLGNYEKVVTDSTAGPLFVNTAIFTIGSSAMAIIIAGTLAWIVTSTNVPGARYIRFLPLAPLLMPGLLKDTAWVQLYSPRTGLVNIGIQDLFGLSDAPFNIFSMMGMVVNVGLNMVPMAYLIISVALLSMNRSLDEASRASGASSWMTLRKIVIPILAPALLSAFALTAIIVASAFETPIVIGQPAGIQTYISAIFRSISGQAIPDYNLAAAQSVVYLVINGCLVTWYLLATRREHRFVVVTGKGQLPGIRRFGWTRYLLLAIVLLYFLFAFVQLFVMTVLVSLVPFYTVTAGNPFKNLSLTNYRELFTTDLTHRAIVNSIRISSFVALLSTACAGFIAFVALKTRIRGRRALEAIGTFPIAIPPVVFSVAILLTIVTIPGLLVVYGTEIPLIVVQAMIFLPFALRLMSTRLIQIHGELLEAAAASGARIGRRAVTIILPLAKPAIIYAICVTFVLSFRELGAVALLTTANTPLVPTVALNYWFVGQVGSVAALNVLTVLIPIGLAGVVWLVLEGGERSWRRLKSMRAARHAVR